MLVAKVRIADWKFCFCSEVAFEPNAVRRSYAVRTLMRATRAPATPLPSTKMVSFQLHIVSQQGLNTLVSCICICLHVVVTCCYLLWSRNGRATGASCIESLNHWTESPCIVLWHTAIWLFESFSGARKWWPWWSDTSFPVIPIMIRISDRMFRGTWRKCFHRPLWAWLGRSLPWKS